MFNEEQTREINKIIETALKRQGRQQLHQGDIRPGTIKKQHLEDVIIVFGLAADRPTDDTSGVKAYFAQDTGTFSLWDGEVWLETVLT